MNTQNDDAELATIPFTKQKVTFFLHSHNFFCSQNYDYKFLTTPTCGMSYYYQENVSLYDIRKLMPTLNRGTDFTNTKESVIT